MLPHAQRHNSPPQGVTQLPARLIVLTPIVHAFLSISAWNIHLNQAFLTFMLFFQRLEIHSYVFPFLAMTRGLLPLPALISQPQRLTQGLTGGGGGGGGDQHLAACTEERLSVCQHETARSRNEKVRLLPRLLAPFFMFFAQGDTLVLGVVAL